MENLTYNKENKNLILQHINECIGVMNNIETQLANIYIPGDFYYYYTFYQEKTNISNNKKDLDTYKQNINNFLGTIESVIEDFEKNINSMENPVIPEFSININNSIQLENIQKLKDATKKETLDYQSQLNQQNSQLGNQNQAVQKEMINYGSGLGQEATTLGNQNQAAQKEMINYGSGLGQEATTLGNQNQAAQKEMINYGSGLDQEATTLGNQNQAAQKEMINYGSGLDQEATTLGNQNQAVQKEMINYGSRLEQQNISNIDIPNKKESLDINNSISTSNFTDLSTANKIDNASINAGNIQSSSLNNIQLESNNNQRIDINNTISSQSFGKIGEQSRVNTEAEITINNNNNT